MILGREHISKNSKVPAILLAAFFNELNERNELIILRKEALKSEEIL
jgi:hypothetical protein